MANLTLRRLQPATLWARTILALLIAFGLSTSSLLAQAGAANLSAEWSFKTSGTQPGTAFFAAVEVSLDNHFHVQSDKDENFPTELIVKPPTGITLREIVYPASVPFEVAGEPALVFEEEFTIGLALDVASDVLPGEYPISISLSYQACDNRICLLPAQKDLSFSIKVVASGEPVLETNSAAVNRIKFSENPVAPAPQPRVDREPVPTISHDCDVLKELENFELLGTAGGLMGADEFIGFIDGAESGTLKRSFFDDKGPIAIVLAVIIGGVLLNLTPCVLPLIPINLAILGAGSQAGSRARGFALGGTYGLAMAIVYGIFGLIVVFGFAKFGGINSTIWFNVAIAVLFVFLALAMFDVIAIDFTKYQANLDATKFAKRGTFGLAFFMGCVTAILAGACVAPVVIQVVVYAGDQYARGQTLALSLPFFLGLGMALPWPFAGAGLSFLPKPGMWMVRVKQAMGVFILLFAAYYAYLAYGIWDSRQVDPAAVQTAVQEQLEGGWTSSICAGLAEARAENKIIFIDMWATWCKNCLAMDKTTFKNERVVERMKGMVKVKFQAEDLNASPAKEMLERFEGIGLPHYAVLKPKAK